MRYKGEVGFTASYDSGTCTDCGQSISAGEEIATSSMGAVNRYHHVQRCPGASVMCSICGGEWYECGCP